MELQAYLGWVAVESFLEDVQAKAQTVVPDTIDSSVDAWLKLVKEGTGLAGCSLAHRHVYSGLRELVSPGRGGKD
jgi:hypothetical protein